MAYHDVNPQRGVFHLLRRRGRATDVLPAGAVTEAMITPPATRAAMRGEVISTARAYGAESTVDWVHHKLTDRPLDAVMLKDPFAVVDSRIDALLDKLGDRSSQLRERTLEERRRSGASLALTDRYALLGETERPEPPLI